MNVDVERRMNRKRQYMKNKYHSRMEEIRNRLGGKCARCGSIEDLQLDHINRSTKVFDITKIITCPKLLEIEVPKLQVLCKPCHYAKSTEDYGNKRELHGQTWAAYFYCKPIRCRKCKKFYTTYKRRRKVNGPG